MLAVLKLWYEKPIYHPLTLCLLPFSWLFRAIIATRRWCYRTGILKTHAVSVPVIVVGNITVGGTGKTPFVIWLAQMLQSQGMRVGIISRGYGAKEKGRRALWVRQDADANEVGDEAVMIARRTGCPLVIANNRVKAAALIAKAPCDVIISDDGLQHYRLARDIEIAIVDSGRGFGNARFLPAGPLREAPSRLAEVDFVINHGAHADRTFDDKKNFSMHLKPLACLSVNQLVAASVAIDDFNEKSVHAVAGIGHPQRFFASLRALGFSIIEHVFPDHHAYTAEDFSFADDLPIIMTEKDAVKCGAFAPLNCWYLQVEASVSEEFAKIILQRLPSAIL